MKKLEEFVNDIINEGRPKGSKNKKTVDDPKFANFDKMDGKSAEDNGTKGYFGVNEPIDNDVADDIDLNSEDNTESVEDLIDKFDAEEDFFIQGRAGWGKTSIIKKLAKKYGRDVITVYLDKAEATDLGGIPVPVEGKNSKAKVTNHMGKEEEREFAVQIKAMPSWAKIMLDNPDKKFLLFFDEMNQATPDVMNALMPIVLEHEICEVAFDNFFVGAAGNLEDENEEGINELSGPLKSRFKPIIKWDAGSDKAWKQAFNHLHKKWDSKLGKNVVDAFENASKLFDNPREIEHKIFQFTERLKELGDTGRIKADKYLRRLNQLVSENIGRTDREKTLPKLADMMVACIKNENVNLNEPKRKTREMMPENIKQIFDMGIQQGFISIEGDDHKYGISKENIQKVINDIDERKQLNGEMIQRYIDMVEENGIKFKYQTDDEWKKAGYTDPLELKLTKDMKPKNLETPKKETPRKYNKD